MGLLSILLLGIISLIFFVIFFFFYNVRSHSKHFKKYNIPYMGAGVGRLVKMLTGQVSTVEMEKEFYREAQQHDSPIVGFTDMMLGPAGVYVKDAQLLRNILVKEFEHFINRRSFGSQKSNFYFKRMLFSMEGEQWKGVRAKMSPTFTTGKIKRMFQMFNTSGGNLIKYMKTNMKPEGDLDVSKIFSKYTMDVIASCAFGLESKAWDVPFGQTSTFEDMGRELQFNFKPLQLLKFIVIMCSPKLADLFGFETFDRDAQNYFSTMIKDVIKRRRQTGERVEDFLQLMLDAQKGLLNADEETNLVMNGSPENDENQNGLMGATSKVTFDDDDLLANSLLFLLAGFDATHSLLMWCAYALATNPEVQEKLFDEISLKMDTNGGKLAYESILEMTYLDMVINEILRMYSPATRTERCCTKDYLVPGTNFTIKKGTIIVIPVYCIQNDPSNFSNPEKFIPERFTSENKSRRNPYTFLPWGHGPRNCIGMRFALMEVKAVVVQLVYTFQLSPSAKTPIPMVYDQTASLKPKGGLSLKITSRKK